MISLIISLLAALAVGWFIARDLSSTGWGVFCGAVTALIVQFIIGLALRKRVNARQNRIQELLNETRSKAERQLAGFQQRRPGDMRGAQELILRIQREGVREALRETDNFAPLYKWNFLLKRQINTMKIQLYYQLADYKMVDQLLPRALLIDPQSLAIKLVRMFKNDDPGLDKFYRRKCAKLKSDTGAFIASVYAWIKIRQGDVAAARETLIAAKKRSDNAILIENCDKLLNGKEKQYSLQGFGDAWYALALEEPKVKMQRQRQQHFYR